MYTSMIQSLSAMRAAQLKIDSIGNNMVNVETNGYKSQDVAPTLANTSGESTVKQGFLEQSNVDLQKEMSALMEAQRTFQLNSRALSFSDQMGNIINNIYNR